MGYLIKVRESRRPVADLANRIHLEILKTRFVCEVRVEERYIIRLDPVRLFMKKDYCGNHPGPCPLTGRKHGKRPYLEGLDWVSFNDLINNLLDRRSVSADVGTSHCVTRKRRRRRICYDYGRTGFEWERVAPDDDYEDWCGRRAPRSDYPDGTPGVYGFSRISQLRYAHAE